MRNHNNSGQRQRLANQVLRQQFNVNTVQNVSLGQTQQLGSVESSMVASLTPEQMYSNFEEWIKMCTDNKINATNTWNFALIDYFHEMTFIRDGDSINFQKASYTLDGCIKIYTSRIDSVASETGKLLSGLTDSVRNPSEEEEIHRDDSEKRIRRRVHRSETTLLKDFSSLALKKFDLDFAVDPLFKKTSADFDEGGARGLLLNHLGIDRNCKIIFDASDAITDQDSDMNEVEEPHIPQAEETPVTPELEEDSEEEQQQEKEQEKEQESSVVLMEIDSIETEESESNVTDIFVDVAAAAATTAATTTATTNLVFTQESSTQDVLVEISRLKARLPAMDMLSELQICPTLQGYAFFSKDSDHLPSLEDSTSNDTPSKPEKVVIPLEDTIANPIGEDDMGDVLDTDFDFDPIDEGEDIMGIIPFELDEDGQPTQQDNQTPIMDKEDSKENEMDFSVDEIKHKFGLGIFDKDDRDLFNYFDTSLAKNWAGPEHWKLRRPIRGVKEAMNQETTANGESQVRKKTKEALQIDFFNCENDMDEETLFATDKKIKLTIPVAKEPESTLHLLPDDMHFSSKQLLKFFLKPTFTINTRNKNGSLNKQKEEESCTVLPTADTVEEPDAQYWADQDIPDVDYNDMDDTPSSHPDSEQIQMTTFDDAAFYQDTFHDSVMDKDEYELYGDQLITNHRLNKAKPLYVNYAKTSKRVDVKKLKDNIWKALTKPSKELPVSNPEDADKLLETRRFTEVVQDLKQMYSAKTMKDISIPFCFICLLHLANEKNLTIENPAKKGQNEDDEDDDFVLGERDWIMDGTLLNEITVFQNL